MGEDKRKMNRCKLDHGIAYWTWERNWLEIIFIGKMPEMGYWLPEMSVGEEFIEDTIKELFATEEYIESETYNPPTFCSIEEAIAAVGDKVGITPTEVAYIMGCTGTAWREKTKTVAIEGTFHLRNGSVLSDTLVVGLDCPVKTFINDILIENLRISFKYPERRFQFGNTIIRNEDLIAVQFHETHVS